MYLLNHTSSQLPLAPRRMLAFFLSFLVDFPLWLSVLSSFTQILITLLSHPLRIGIWLGASGWLLKQCNLVDIIVVKQIRSLGRNRPS